MVTDDYLRLDAHSFVSNATTAAWSAMVKASSLRYREPITTRVILGQCASTL